MNKNIKMVGLGILILLILFLTVSFVFQKTTTKTEIVTNEDGEELIVEMTQMNFFAKVIDFISTLFSSSFSITLSSTPEINEPFTATFKGSIDMQCQVSGGSVKIMRDGGLAKIWSLGTSLPSAGESFSYALTYTPDKAGDYTIINTVEGELVMIPWLCQIPATTTEDFCDDILTNYNCDSTDLNLCYSRMTSSVSRCFYETKTFTIEEAVTECPDNYQTETSVSITNGDITTITYYTYSSFPTCSKSSYTKEYIECDSGYEEVNDKCVEESNDVTCYQCDGTNRVSDVFQDKCDSGWYLDKPDCSVYEPVVCYQCSGDNTVAKTFEGSCDSDWYETEPQCGEEVTNPQTTTETVTCYKCDSTGAMLKGTFDGSCDSGWYLDLPDCSGVSSESIYGGEVNAIIDFENNPVQSWIITGLIGAIIFGLLIFVPFTKGGKK